MLLLLFIENYIYRLESSPLGTSMASIDRHGVCLISGVDTNGYSYHINA